VTGFFVGYELALLSQQSAWEQWWRAQPRLVSWLPPGPFWFARPRPGEVWRAELPFCDAGGPGPGDCLVIRVHAFGVDVLPITQLDRSGRPGFVEISTHHTEDVPRRRFLDCAAALTLHDLTLRGHLGYLDDQRAMTVVANQHRMGWVV
jgi:hypothetical protein